MTGFTKKEIRNACRKLWGVKWYDVPVELKRARKAMARAALKVEALSVKHGIISSCENGLPNLKPNIDSKSEIDLKSQAVSKIGSESECVKTRRRLTSLELFSGNATVSKVLESEFNFTTHTLDFRKEMNPSICADFMTWDYKAAFKPGEIDFLWASPDCKTWSLATHKHRVPLTRRGVPTTNPLEPITEYAKLCDKMIVRLIEVIDYLKPKRWIIENPRGRLRYFPPMKRLEQKNHLLCAYYSNYGHYMRKRTDFWSNVYLWDNEKLDKELAKSCISMKKVNTYNARIAIPSKLISRLIGTALRNVSM